MIFRTDFCIKPLAQLGAQRQEVVGRVNCHPPPPHTHTDTKGNAALLRKGVDKKINHGSWFDTYPIATYLPTYLRYALHVSRTAKNGGDRQVRSKLRGAKRNHSKLIHWEIKQMKQNIHTILYLKQATEEPFYQSRRVATTTTASIYNLTEYIHVW